MEHFLSLCFIPLASWTSSVTMQPVDLMMATSQSISEGNTCTTKDGQSGLLMDIATCQELILKENPLSVYWPKNDTFDESVVCCSALPAIKSADGSNRRKRQAPSPPPGVPNLRVKGCGVRMSVSDFIIGGRTADFWPWMAAIFVKASGARPKRFLCGGVVISRRFILSAAHCFGQRGRTLTANTLIVRVGSLRISEGTDFAVSNVIVHENYRNNLHYDDIALLRTSKDIQAKQVVPVCLPSTGMYNANFFQRQATVLGWGDVSYDGNPSDVLMEATVPVVPNKKCDRAYRRLSPLSLPRGIIDTQICAGAQDTSRDACQGDSGGPLILEGRARKWNVVGLVSFGYRCGEPEYPGVYTRVAKYLPWLWIHTDIRRK